MAMCSIFVSNCKAHSFPSVYANPCLLTVGPVRHWAKNKTQRFDFTRARTTNDWLLFSPELCASSSLRRLPLLSCGLLFTRSDLHRERLLRIWQEFWDVLIAQDPQLRVPDKRTEKAKREGKPLPSASAGAKDEAKQRLLAEGKQSEVVQISAEGEQEEHKYEPVSLDFHQGKTPPYLLNFRGLL